MSKSSFLQLNRPMRITTPLGADALLVESFTGSESLSRPFQYELVLRSEDHDISYKNLIGQSVTISVDKEGADPRVFHGYISRFAQTKYEDLLAEYRATVVPWLWFLTRSSDCRVFQNLSIPEIVKQVFTDHGFSDVIDRLNGSYRKWEYCVQYRETAFAFVSRLMEEEGIYYFFKHEADKHSIVLCDSPASHRQFAGYEDLSYRPSARDAQETLWSWAVEHEVESGAYFTANFDFTAPKRNVIGSSFLDRDHSSGHLEQFDYLGEQSPFAEEDRYAQLRLQELQAQHERYAAEGDARGICTGARFTLKNHPRPEFEQEYLTTGAEYALTFNSSVPTRGASPAFEYNVKFKAIPLEQQFRPPRLTPRPRVHGPQTATVVGPSGETVHTDQYGRVKIQFHWDRHGASNENSSCWVRVSQQWAGATWGAMFIPHLGQEVIVDCLEGDPDRPIITGRVYNKDQMPPLDLPANKHKAIIRDDATNQIVLDATAGQEQISIYCPNNRSTVDVGGHIKIKTEAEKQVLTLGDSYTATIGQTMSVNCGTTVQAFAGLNAQAVVGAQINVTLAGSFDLFAGVKATAQFGGFYEYTKGFKYSNCNGAEFSASDDTYHKRSSEDVIMDADQTLCLIGGDDDHSLAKMGNDGILLSVGKGEPKAALEAARDQKNRMLKALVFGLLMTGGAAGAMMAGTAVEAKNDENDAQPDSSGSNAQKLPDVDTTGLAVAAGLLGVVCLAGAVGMTVLGRRINEADKVEAADRAHTDVHSKIELKDQKLHIASGKSRITIDKDGKIVISNTQGDGQIQLLSKQKIVLSSQAEIKIVGTKVEASKGIFQTKNIKDLG
jgi:type VI secretion system secreted protein VgrG